MIVGIVKLLIFISSSNSLKEKRMVLLSLKNKLKNNFNVSVTEIGDQDKWQKSALALSTVGTKKASLNSMLSRVINYLENSKQVQLLDYEMEMI